MKGGGDALTKQSGFKKLAIYVNKKLKMDTANHPMEMDH